MTEELIQPTINIGLLGHVANGKSSLVRTITGEKTARNDSRCMQKGESREMTIQLGYSNAKIYQCGHCEKPWCYTSIEGSKKEIPQCGSCGLDDEMTLVKYISFIDAPGHRNLMQNMISGSAVMDAAILVTDINGTIPQVQTAEHLTAAEIIGINHYIAVVQNKVDLLIDSALGVGQEQRRTSLQERLQQSYKQISDFVEETGADLSRTPVLPTCFSPAKSINLQLLLQQIVERALPNPNPVYQQYPMFIYCIRSFDINKPGPFMGLKGGVIGGTIMNGTLRIGDKLEIRPGYKDEQGNYQPLYTTVQSLFTGTVPLTKAKSGGLIGIGTDLDPALMRGDTMVGMCAGTVGTLPEPTSSLDLQVFLLKQGIGHEQEVMEKIGKLQVGDVLQLAVGSGTVHAKIVKKLKKRQFRFETALPVCPVPGQSIPLSKMHSGAWMIIGKSELLTAGQVTNIGREPPTMPPFPDYRVVVEDLLDSNNKENKDHYQKKTVIPPVKMYKDGGAKLVWENFQDTCEALHRDMDHVQRYFQEELPASTTRNAKEQLIIHGKNRYKDNHIQNLLVKYIRAYVSCPSCKSLKTTLNKKDSKHYDFVCSKCGAEYLK